MGRCRIVLSNVKSAFSEFAHVLSHRVARLVARGGQTQRLFSFPSAAQVTQSNEENAAAEEAAMLGARSL